MRLSNLSCHHKCDANFCCLYNKCIATIYNPSLQTLIYNHTLPTSHITSQNIHIHLDLDTLANLGHFVMVISMLLRRYVVDIATNLESMKLHIMGRGNCDELELMSHERRP